MFHRSRLRRVSAAALSLLLIVWLTVPSVFAYIAVQTPPKKNEFVPAEDIDVFIRKTVEHPFGENYAVPDTISFDFSVDLGRAYALTPVTTSQGTKMADENGCFVLTLKPNESVSLEGLAHGAVLTVTELPSEHRGFSVKGSSSQTVTVDKTQAATLKFVNVYSPAPASLNSLTATVTKILTGRAWQTSDRFRFKLEQLSPEGTRELAVHTVSYRTDDPTFNAFDVKDLLLPHAPATVGTYHYRISEIADGMTGISYDASSAEFTLTITDADMDGALEIGAVTASGAMALTEDADGYHLTATFNNRYTPATKPTTTTKPSGGETTLPTTRPTTPTTPPEKPDTDDPLPPSTGNTGYGRVCNALFVCATCVFAMLMLAKRRTAFTP